ncbi:hypothetical protein GCM10010174_30150 [Kutzneria viridogrisea]
MALPSWGFHTGCPGEAGREGLRMRLVVVLNSLVIGVAPAYRVTIDRRQRSTPRRGAGLVRPRHGSEAGGWNPRGEPNHNQPDSETEVHMVDRG